MTAQLPRPDDYNSAVQNPRTAFKDPVLQSSRVQTNPLGLPIVAGGGFTVVYPMQGAGQRWAVRCFHRPMPGLQGRYQAISEFVQRNPRPYFVPVEYQHDGILVQGSYHPIIRMPWVEGHTLSSYIERTIQQPAQFAQLADAFAHLVGDLERLGAAHGDLQHGNILVVNGQLKLIDYDSVFVPALAGQVSTTFGHVNFQHPSRSASDFNGRIDHFSAMVIYLALRALAIEPGLWKTYGAGGENLLFRQSDFVNPSQSKLLIELERLPPLRGMVAQFRSYFKASLDTIPSLETLIAGTQVQVAQIAHQTSTLRRQYEVVRADDLTTLRDRVNQRVEVLGKITGVDNRTTKNGSPMVFVDFGDWRQSAFRLVLWSSGIELFRTVGIDLKSYQGKWVSITGVVTRYIDQQKNQDRVQITIELPSEIEAIGGEAEVTRRLAGNAHLRTAQSTPLPAAHVATPPPKAAPTSITPAQPVRPLPPTQPVVAVAQNPSVRPPTRPRPISYDILPPMPPLAAARKPAPGMPTAPTSARASAGPRSACCPWCVAVNRPGAKACGQCGSALHPPTRFDPGQSIHNGKYSIKRLLSRGGMGEVYIAIEHHPSLPDRERIVKVMLDYYDVTNPQSAHAARARFKQEATTLCTLRHKTIPMVFDYFDEGQDACITMEFIEGVSLERQLTHTDANGRAISGTAYPRKDVIRWGIEICRVLEYLSSVQPLVVHQDIKPANLLVDQQGDIRLVDFGGNAAGWRGVGFDTTGYIGVYWAV